jgi:purine-binding chemotaxis protein CheW
MDDAQLLPPEDGEIAALLDDWLASAPAEATPAESAPSAAPQAASPDTPSGAATLLDALRAESVPDVLIDPAAVPAAPARRDRYVVFTIADTAYAVREASVTEVERIPAMTPVPRVPAWLRGVTSLRGEVLSVVDLRTWLGLDQTTLHSGRLLVVRLSGDELALGLLVDRVERIATAAADGVRPPESPLEGPLAPYLTGVARLSGRTAAVLDLDALLTSADLRRFDDRKPE